MVSGAIGFQNCGKDTFAGKCASWEKHTHLLMLSSLQVQLPRLKTQKLRESYPLGFREALYNLDEAYIVSVVGVGVGRITSKFFHL